MATSFSLYCNGTTVQLNSSPILTTNYESGQGEEAGDITRGYKPMAESLDLTILAASASAAKTIIRSIDAMREACKRRQERRAGPKVFFRAQYDTDSNPWEAELFDLQLTYDNFPDKFWRGAVEARLSFIRAGIFDYTSESELSISSYAGGAATGGRNVLNDGVNNWFHVSPGAIDGTAPGLVRVNVQNKTGSNRAYEYIYIGNNAFSSPSTFQQYIQAENFLTGSLGGSDPQSSGSGNNTAGVTITTLPTYYLMWRFTAQQMAAAGRWFRIILRTGGGELTEGLDVKVRLSILDYYGLLTIWRGGDTTLKTGIRIHDLGAVPIPPAAFASDYAPVCLGMEIWSPNFNYFRADYLGVLGTDSFRRIEGLGFLISNNDYFEIDDILGRAHSIEGTGKHPIFAAFGEPLTVFPGTDNRFAMIIETSQNNISDVHSVRLYYKPARFMI